MLAGATAALIVKPMVTAEAPEEDTGRGPLGEVDPYLVMLEQGVIVPQPVLSAVRPKRGKIKQVKRHEIRPNFGTVILGSPQVVPTMTKTGLLPKQTDIRGPRGPLDCLPGGAVLLVLATTPVAGAEVKFCGNWDQTQLPPS